MISSQITKWRFIVLGILILSLVWIGFSADPGGKSLSSSMSAPQSGFLAPDFTLQTIENQQITLSNLRGKVVLVNLWATWCPPCQAEMPAIEAIYEEYKDQGLEILGVNTTYQDTPTDLEQFIPEHHLTFPILLDSTALISKQYQLQALPTSFFIDRKGIIREVVVGGPMSTALLRSKIEQLIQEKN